MDRVERGVLRQVIQVGSGRNSRHKYLDAILESKGTCVGWFQRFIELFREKGEHAVGSLADGLEPDVLPHLGCLVAIPSV
jgi:hypothetical protein